MDGMVQWKWNMWCKTTMEVKYWWNWSSCPLWASVHEAGMYHFKFLYFVCCLSQAVLYWRHHWSCILWCCWTSIKTRVHRYIIPASGPCGMYWCNFSLLSVCLCLPVLFIVWSWFVCLCIVVFFKICWYWCWSPLLFSIVESSLQVQCYFFPTNTIKMLVKAFSVYSM